MKVEKSVTGFDKMLPVFTLLSLTKSRRPESWRKHYKVRVKVLGAFKGYVPDLIPVPQVDNVSFDRGKIVWGKATSGKDVYAWIIWFADEQPRPNTETFVWCSCPDFTYRCEVALAYRGSSTVINSTGAKPVQTNPQMIPWICKHITAALPWAVSAKAEQSGLDDLLVAIQNLFGSLVGGLEL